MIDCMAETVNVVCPCLECGRSPCAFHRRAISVFAAAWGALSPLSVRRNARGQGPDLASEPHRATALTALPLGVHDSVSAAHGMSDER
jgi:hypothetical protein